MQFGCVTEICTQSDSTWVSFGLRIRSAQSADLWLDVTSDVEELISGSTCLIRAFMEFISLMDTCVEV
jgi:hypothetical protein